MKSLSIWVKWLLYWWATSDERHYYDMGKIKGKHCIGRDYIRPGVYDYWFDPDKEPTREFLTRQEFFNLYKESI